ncbi:MAG: Type 1 glutamine amidotransferase-like domain-containing protein [Janthinobacterium lividum]
MQRILAIGGGGFSMDEVDSPIDAFLVKLTGKTRPRICYLGTPSGDFFPHISDFHEVYEALGCETSHLSFFGQGGPKSISVHDFKERIFEQDAIFVCGGNPRAAIAVWRAWGLDAVLHNAWRKGTILAGMSAGAMCWFENAIQFPAGTYNGVLDCLGMLPGGCCVHYEGAHGSERRDNLLTGNGIKIVGSAVAIDDYAAVLFSGKEIETVLSWRPDATACRVEYVKGVVRETPLPATSIMTKPMAPPRDEVGVDPAILRRYVGQYDMRVPDVMTISMEDDTLFTQLPGQPKLRLFSSSEQEFFLKIVDAQLTFDVDHDGRVSVMHRQNGREIPGSRREIS